VEDFFDAEAFEQLVFAADGGEGLFDERCRFGGLRD